MSSQSPRKRARLEESNNDSLPKTPTTSKGRIYVISDATPQSGRSLRSGPSGSRKVSSRKPRKDGRSSPDSSPTKPNKSRGRLPTKPSINSDDIRQSDSSLTDEDLRQAEDSDDEINGLPSSPLKGKGKSVLRDLSPPPLSRSSFEAYFEAFSKKSVTSSSAYSFLVHPLPTSFDFASTIPQYSALCQVIEEQHVADFPRWILELQEGFNILFYGYGSKHDILMKFAKEACAKRGDVALVNGTSPSCGLKDIIGALSNFVPSSQKETFLGKSLDAQAKGIYEHYAFGRCRRHLYLIIESIDSPALLNPKAREFINVLASLPNAHLAGSVEHLNAPLAWSAREIYCRKLGIPDEAVTEEESTSEEVQTLRQSFHGLQVLWHDLSTLKPYLPELNHRDLTVPPTTSSNKRSKASQQAGAPGMVSETAAQHILASVTERAKKLFAFVAGRQLASVAVTAISPSKSNEPPSEAIPYSALFAAARDDFLVTNDAQLKALLGEFTDHGLITLTTARAESEHTGEVLWVAMRPDALRAVVGGLSQSN